MGCTDTTFWLLAACIAGQSLLATWLFYWNNKLAGMVKTQSRTIMQNTALMNEAAAKISLYESMLSGSVQRVTANSLGDMPPEMRATLRATLKTMLAQIEATVN
ncbi:MAG TPA: hypothetical protein VKB76_09160 [Ktedonobacterales bacterium]|nr:hypothetical protein [Ktedonobacterales bacterium]